MTRERLLNRRHSETFEFQWEGMHFVATYSRYADKRVSELFLSNGRVNSQVGSMVRDAAVAVSLALQHGTPIETLQKALLRNPQGEAATPIGKALDLIVRQSDG